MTCSTGTLMKRATQLGATSSWFTISASFSRLLFNRNPKFTRNSSKFTTGHGSLNVPMFHITQPLGIWSIMATIRWCPIFPKWDIYQPLLESSPNGSPNGQVAPVATATIAATAATAASAASAATAATVATATSITATTWRWEILVLQRFQLNDPWSLAILKLRVSHTTATLNSH